MVSEKRSDVDVTSGSWTLLDERAPVHFSAGLFAGLSNWNTGWALVAVFGTQALLMAIAESSIEAPFQRTVKSTPGNAAVDVFLGICGLKLGEWIRRVDVSHPPSGVSGIENQFPLARTAQLIGRGHVSRR